MILDVPDNLIAQYQTLDEILPYEQYQSGALDAQKPVYRDTKESTSNPILTLDFDIINEYGFGLKRGYYEIATDRTYSFLMFVQAGKIAAKIPVIKQEVISEYGSDFEWSEDKDKTTPNSASKGLTNEIEVYSKQQYIKQYGAREAKRRIKKYKKGQDPSLYFHSKAYVEYDSENDLYKVIFEKYNTRLIGIIKI